MLRWMPMNNPIFLSAEWKDLLMLNYVVDPALLKPLLPPGTELDFRNGTTFLSVVGFRSFNTRALGFAFPFHRNFEEVNLRFYVRRRAESGWRRGVVFIREFVPRRAIAFVARTCYGEPYSALPMSHTIQQSGGGIRAEYRWRRNGEWESLQGEGVGGSAEIEAGSIEEFITEHYWGYTACRGACAEYQVEHPRWRVWPAKNAILRADVKSLYGAAFRESLSVPPAFALIADGSPVIVRRRSMLQTA